MIASKNTKMKMLFSCQILCLLFLIYIDESSTKSVPFLYVSNQAPLESHRPISNIANLRRSKAQDLSKAPEYEVENYPDDSHNETNHNEVIPGFFHKQLEKVYSKLQFLANHDKNDDQEISFSEIVKTNQTVSESPDRDDNNSTNIEVLLKDEHPKEQTDLRSVFTSSILTPLLSFGFRIFSYFSSSSTGLSGSS